MKLYDVNYIRKDGAISFSDRVRMALIRRNILKKLLLKKDPYNIVRDTIEESYLNYKKMMRRKAPLPYIQIDRYLRECDALVCNGEGTFIFTNPPRYDSIFYTLLLKLAQEYGKETYLLNAMFSDCPKTGRNETMLKECRSILENCTKVTARDPLSYSYYKEHLGSNVEYVPDALFTWTKYQKYLPLATTHPKVFATFPEYGGKMWDYDFSRPYICLSGSSLAAWRQEEAQKAYTRLAFALKGWALKNDMQLYIMPTCSGDAFLEKVALATQCPLVPVTTNILGGMSILANARVFVSGRWHPSILASLGGTPCVFLGSNSHKTHAIQEMLGNERVKEYSAIPTAEDISMIVTDVDRIIHNKKERDNILKIVQKLSDMSLHNRIQS